ncbi:hypothetical protein VCHA53O466_50078 [Vibrio chagasii]|nr:hypothetical protein VCHA53O466_50078 [Vibrio chagasii]
MSEALKCKIVITEDKTHFVAPLKVEDWVSNILETKPETIYVFSSTQLSALRCLVLSNKMIITHCDYYGNDCFVHPCGAIEVHPDLDMDRFVSESLMRSAFDTDFFENIAKITNPKLLINIIVSESVDHAVTTSEIPSWLQGIISSTGEMDVNITDIDQYQLIHGCLVSHNIMIKTVCYGSEKVEFNPKIHPFSEPNEKLWQFGSIRNSLMMECL